MPVLDFFFAFISHNIKIENERFHILVNQRLLKVEICELFEYELNQIESGKIRFDSDLNLYNSNLNYSKISNLRGSNTDHILSFL